MGASGAILLPYFDYNGEEFMESVVKLSTVVPSLAPDKSQVVFFYLCLSPVPNKYFAQGFGNANFC